MTTVARVKAPSPKPARQPRTIKSAKQRAEERLAAAQRAFLRASNAAQRLDAALAAARDEQRIAGLRLDHAKADPDLRDDPTLPFGGEVDNSHVDGHGRLQ